MNTHKNTKPGHQSNHRSSTVADQRQRHSDHGQYAGYHAYVDKNVKEKGDAEAASQQPGIGVGSGNGDIQPAANDITVQQ